MLRQGIGEVPLLQTRTATRIILDGFNGRWDMAIREVRKAPDPVLLRKTRRVSKIDSSIHRLIDDLFDTMYAERGVGLAANQVGVPLRVFVMGIPEDQDGERTVHEYALINAVITKKFDEELMEEGCLSIPGFRGQITRATRVKVKALDRDGKDVHITAEGLLAQALQHEIDHLDGILYVDRMKEQGTLETLRDISKEQVEEAAAA
ncbi:MAG: Peptide deformylase [Dehalococcoidia bacterium]|nr:Peptide deformylase [Dehalococcoidia bacterium]